MAHVPASDVVVTPAQREEALPEPTVIVTPATREEPLEPELTGEERSIAFEGHEYTFPKDTTDDEMFEFLNQIPKAEPEEKAEPLRERAVIKKDEGVRKDKEGKHVSYLDTEKILTGGRGHVLTKKEKKLYPKGTVIPDALVKQWFDEDLEEADSNLTELLEEKAVHVSDEVYDILLNMSFNLGKKGLKGFKDMWKAIEVSNWKEASEEMEDSKWFKQVKSRAVRLVDRMAAISTTKEETPVAAEETKSNLTPSKGGLFEDETGKLVLVDEQGNKTEV